ncbi:hypothetical protein [Methanimicrococcus blatticola]|uniref:hypothetical protein n=1 Tax=Methanimicrococcus blatticola TaxID=91560 RepID=UPI001414E2A4|nr:hypothetical protein [Methanimicrococcus blatticola]MBZ3935732.1 hypothetical protein [Methanimicrococcus blatticola]MCC2508148.1 hypothetical protein [Methanimicrococcus blatticola]
MSVLLHASALFYDSRSLRERAAATLPFALLPLPYRLRCCDLACCIGIIVAIARAAPLF